MICRWYPVCPIKKYHEQGEIEPDWVADYCMVSNPNCMRKRLEEQGIYHPDNMMPDGSMRQDPK